MDFIPIASDCYVKGKCDGCKLSVSILIIHDSNIRACHMRKEYMMDFVYKCTNLFLKHVVKSTTTAEELASRVELEELCFPRHVGLSMKPSVGVFKCIFFLVTFVFVFVLFTMLEATLLFIVSGIVG